MRVGLIALGAHNPSKTHQFNDLVNCLEVYIGVVYIPPPSTRVVLYRRVAAAASH
jgi:hypothetical protein